MMITEMMMALFNMLSYQLLTSINDDVMKINYFKDRL